MIGRRMIERFKDTKKAGSYLNYEFTSHIVPVHQSAPSTEAVEYTDRISAKR